jgi:hypothetical protein
MEIPAIDVVGDFEADVPCRSGLGDWVFYTLGQAAGGIAKCAGHIQEFYGRLEGVS